MRYVFVLLVLVAPVAALDPGLHVICCEATNKSALSECRELNTSSAACERVLADWERQQADWLGFNQNIELYATLFLLAAGVVVAGLLYLLVRVWRYLARNR